MNLADFAKQRTLAPRCRVCALDTELRDMIDRGQQGTGGGHVSDYAIQEWLSTQHRLDLGMTSIGNHRRQKHASRY